MSPCDQKSQNQYVNLGVLTLESWLHTLSFLYMNFLPSAQIWERNRGENESRVKWNETSAYHLLVMISEVYR